MYVSPHRHATQERIEPRSHEGTKTRLPEHKASRNRRQHKPLSECPSAILLFLRTLEQRAYGTPLDRHPLRVFVSLWFNCFASLHEVRHAFDGGERGLEVLGPEELQVVEQLVEVIDGLADAVVFVGEVLVAEIGAKKVAVHGVE